MHGFFRGHVFGLSPVRRSVKEIIRLEHGSGGALSRNLIEETIFPRLKNHRFAGLSDAADLGSLEDVCFTTDSFVVDPPFFPGGDIGKLAVFGTCNDLAVSGAAPRFLSLAFVLEAGFPMSDLVRIVDSVAEACEMCRVKIVTGDTKVVESGSGGGIYINTSGIGTREHLDQLGPDRIETGDKLIISDPIGSHGIAVLAAREQLPGADRIISDCRNLSPSTRALHKLGASLKLMRDATRGGVAAVTNELIRGGNHGIELVESSIPVLQEVRTATRLLGLAPIEIANEGVFVAVVSESEANNAVDLLTDSGCVSPAIVGTVNVQNPGRVTLRTIVGGTRIVDLPRGLLLPRIC